MRYWLNVAPQDSWTESLRMGVCGVPASQLNRYQWDKVQRDDIVLFYATVPIKGLIGWGRVLDTFEDKTPLWPKEIQRGRPIWPLRIRLAVESTLPEAHWRLERVTIDPQISVQRSLMPMAEGWGLGLVAQLKKATGAEHSLET